MRRVAVLFGSDTPIDLAMMRSAEAVARSLGITIAGVDILDGKIERAIADFGKEPDGGLIVLPQPDEAPSCQCRIGAPSLGKMFAECGSKGG